MKNLISLRNISKIYDKEKIQVKALDGVSFGVKRGEFLIIKGRSGSGKTTLLNIIGTLDRPTKGEYRLKGYKLEGRKEKDLARIRNQEIGFIFQTFNLLPRMSILSNIELPLLYGKKKKEWGRKRRALELAEKVGLIQRKNHRPNELSGGEKQRVAIARALINDPTSILADEPTGNLDSKTALAIIELLQKLNREGVTIILVTHEDFIAKYGKRVIKLKDGKIVEDTEIK